MTSFRRAALGLIATGILGAVLGYFYYFRKRRMNFLFGQTYRLLRKQQNKIISTTTANGNESDTTAATKQPVVMSNAEIKQLFFAQEVHLGEQEFSRGNFAGGAKHFALAVTVYEYPDRFLQILQQVLPAPVFMMIIQEVGAIQREIEMGRKLERENCSNDNSSLTSNTEEIEEVKN